MAKKHKQGRGKQAKQNGAQQGQYNQSAHAGYGADAGAQYAQYGQPYTAQPQYGLGGMDAGLAQGFTQGMGMGQGYGAAAQQQQQQQQAVNNSSLLQGMPAFLRTGNTEQFLLGALVGAAAAWVLSDEEMRGKIVKSAMKLYTGVAGGFEEMKEQMADIRAEVEAERHGDA